MVLGFGVFRALFPPSFVGGFCGCCRLEVVMAVRLPYLCARPVLRASSFVSALLSRAALALLWLSSWSCGYRWGQDPGLFVVAPVVAAGAVTIVDFGPATEPFESEVEVSALGEPCRLNLSHVQVEMLRSLLWFFAEPCNDPVFAGVLPARQWALLSELLAHRWSGGASNVLLAFVRELAARELLSVE